MKRWCLLAMILVLAWSAAANAYCNYYKNEYLHVNVPLANDFFKVFVGPAVVVQAWSSAWGPADMVINFGTFVIIKWSGAPVSFCDRVSFCVNMAGVPWIRPVVGVWTLDNVIVGWTGPMWWQWGAKWPGPANDWGLKVRVQNGWKDWVGADYPPVTGDGPTGYVGQVTAQNVWWANLGEGDLLPLPALTDSLWGPGSTITWEPLGNLTLGPQEQGEWILANEGLGEDDRILIRMDLYDESGTGLEFANDIMQFRVHHAGERADEIPTLSQWGLIILGLLLVTAGALAIIRRRRVEA